MRFFFLCPQLWPLGLLTGSAAASDFDTCVLEHMQGVTSDFRKPRSIKTIMCQNG